MAHSKVSYILLSALLSAGVLTACGGEKSDSEAGKTPAPSVQTAPESAEKATVAQDQQESSANAAAEADGSQMAEAEAGSDKNSFLNTPLSLDGSNVSFTLSKEPGQVGDVLKIATGGLTEVNEVYSHDLVGQSITGVEICDLNNDSNPELLVFLQSTGSGSYGSVLAYTVYNGKSSGSVYMPDITQDKALSEGYMGHDSFAVRDGKLIRSFPVYVENDSNAAPTGGNREIVYTLKAGEAGYSFVAESVTGSESAGNTADNGETR